MAKSTKEQKDPIVFRIMIESKNGACSSIDFTSKEESMQYAEKLTNETTAWWGIYEVNPKYRDLKTVTYKRLIPHNDKIPTNVIKPDSTEDSTAAQMQPKRRQRKKST